MWVALPVESLFLTVGGGTPTTSVSEYWGNGIPWFSSADIDDEGNIIPRRNVTPLGVENSTANIVPAGSVVVVTRVGLGKVAIINRDMCFSQDNQALIPRFPKLIDNRFLFYFIFNAMQTLKHSGRGTTISGITKKQLTDIVMLVPPLNEQRRIIEVINSAYVQLNEIAENLI